MATLDETTTSSNATTVASCQAMTYEPGHLGRGVLEDYAWLSIAFAQDSELLERDTSLAYQATRTSNLVRSDISRKMSREQMAAAKQLAREYWKKYVLPFRN